MFGRLLRAAVVAAVAAVAVASMPDLKRYLELRSM